MHIKVGNPNIYDEYGEDIISNLFEKVNSLYIYIYIYIYIYTVYVYI